MESIALNGPWKLYYYDSNHMSVNTPDELAASRIPCIPAKVPGNVELDLSAAGILPADLFKGENILLAEAYESYDWWYETEFESPKAPDGQKMLLRFNGVDCYAEYWLNGAKIGESQNALIEHEFNIAGLLRLSGNNTLHVKISSAIKKAFDKNYDLYAAHSRWVTPEVITARKPPHAYGWDIFPRAVSAGIWRGAEIIMSGAAGFRQLFLYVKSLSKGAAEIRCSYELDCDYKTFRNADVKIRLRGRCCDSAFEHTEKAPFKLGGAQFSIMNPKLWYPSGYGQPNLYDTRAELLIDGDVAASEQIMLGVRTVELKRTDTTDGRSGCFKFIVNGTDIMCRGSNWVALDAYHSRDEGRYAQALALLKDSQCNIVRCWGGNVYEQHAFYDFCDQNGVMVWQDFTMACAAFPQDSGFLEIMRAEAESVVRKLRNHACIVLWAGDNECDELLYSEGVNPAKNKITREVYPDVIHNNDHGRPYLPSSPYISENAFLNNESMSLPERHLWGPRDYYKSDFYKHAKSHFVSETGYHGCPSEASVRKFIDEESVWPYTGNRQWNLHSSDQKNSPHRVELMARQIKQLFGGVPENMEDFILASQISQAEAKKFFIENIRSQKPVKTGVIWWNILDGWPQMSDAVVDYYFEKKLAYHYIKMSQTPLCLMCGEIVSWHLPVYAVNDTLEPEEGRLAVSDGETGEVLYDGYFSVPSNGNSQICGLPMMYSEKRLLLLKWETDKEASGFNHYICGMPPFDLSVYKKWLSIIKREAGIS